MKSFAKLILAFVVSVVLFSCSVTQERKTTTTINYDMKRFRVASQENCDESKSCAEFEINYPEFTGIDTLAASRIRRIVELSFSMGDPEADEKSMAQIARDFLANYEEFTKEIDEPSMGWFYRGETRVNVMNDTLISMSLDEEYFTGGAHGGRGRYFVNVDPRNGNEYTLKDFFKPGFESSLTSAGEEAFRRERELPDSVSLQENYFEFPDDKFQLNGNFGLTPDGVFFYYNNYEIAPYAAGPTEVFIPFDKIKGWMRTSL